MSLSQKKPTISIPEYSRPARPSFSAYGQTATPEGNGFKLIEDPTELADRQAAEQVRRELISSLGLSGTSDPYTQKYLDQSLDVSLPKLENALIQRGLGGSSVYQGAISDLISKATTEAILNSQANKLNALSTLQSSYLGPYQQMGQNLLQLAASTGISQEQLAQAMYQARLPYEAQVNYPKQSGLSGLISGGLQGFMAGGPVGAVVGAGTGYFGSQAPAYSQPYMLSDYYKSNNSGLSLQNLQSLMQLGGF